MTLLLVTAQSHFVANNIFEGLFWFFLPASLVIVNDIFAYICGFFWGKTPLIQLSPKKTWEGFLGGWLCTVIWSIAATELLRRSSYMICPARDLTQNFWQHDTCSPNPVFIALPFNLTPWLAALLRRIVCFSLCYFRFEWCG